MNSNNQWIQWQDGIDTLTFTSVDSFWRLRRQNWDFSPWSGPWLNFIRNRIHWCTSCPSHKSFRNSQKFGCRMATNAKFIASSSFPAGSPFSHSAWHAWWFSTLQPDTWHKMRLGPFNAESNKHAPTVSQLHLVFWTEESFAAARLLACSAALCSSIKVSNLLCASTLVWHGDPWTEVVQAPCKIVINAVGIFDVPGAQEAMSIHQMYCWLQRSQVHLPCSRLQGSQVSQVRPPW